MINANLCRRSDFTLKNSAGGICRDYHRRYHRVEICTLRKQDRLHVARANRLSWGNFALMMFPSITTNDLLLGKRWSERLSRGRKIRTPRFLSTDEPADLFGVDEHVNSESYAVLTKAYRERGGRTYFGIP